MTKLIRNPPGLNHVLLSQLIKSIQIKQKLQVRRLLYNVSTWSVLHLPHHQTLWPAHRVHFYHVQVCDNLIVFLLNKKLQKVFHYPLLRLRLRQCAEPAAVGGRVDRVHRVDDGRLF